MGSSVKKTVLPSGLRIVSEKITSIRSVAIGIWVDVGSRDESEGQLGVSHLIEHMHFKGTRKRSASKVAEDIERLGGSLNAFTTREQTCYYARTLDEHLPEAIDVLSDMLMNSTFTPTNFKREKKVVLEEIKENDDTPSEVVHDIFAEKFWGGSSLSHSILGGASDIEKMTRKTALDYVKDHYNASNVVVSVSGNMDHDKLVSLVKRKLKFPKGSLAKTKEALYPTKAKVHAVERDIAQTHFILGFPSVQFDHKLRFAALCLNFYLGGGMSSVLFQEVREKRGLAYSIYTFQDFYRDVGTFGVCFSSDAKNVQQSLDLILKRLRKVKTTKLAESDMRKVRAQIKGSLTFSMESATGRMNRLARHELMLGKYNSLKKSFALVDKLTASDVLNAAQFIFDESRMIAVSLGPIAVKDFSPGK